MKAGLDDESVGNGPEIFGSEALRRVNTSGTVHAIVIRGEPLFE